MNLIKTCKFILTEHYVIFLGHQPSQFGAKVRHFKRPPQSCYWLIMYCLNTWSYR